jgi:hypothetical protein
MVRLTDAQIVQFCHEGVLHIPGFFTGEQIEAWRQQTYAHSRADPGRPGSWPDGGSTGVSRYLHAPDPAIQARLEYPYDGLTHPFTGSSLGRGPAVDPQPVSPTIGSTQLGEIVEQLLGRDVDDGLRPGPENDTVVIQWPKRRSGQGGMMGCAEQPWAPPQSGHIEGYNPNKGGWVGGFLLGALTYLEDCMDTGCGAFYYCPSNPSCTSEILSQTPLQAG